MMIRSSVVVLIFALGIQANTYDNTSLELPPREHRGTWIATVYNIDWPLSPTSSVTAQQDQLKNLVGEINRARLNAIYFQVNNLKRIK